MKQVAIFVLAFALALVAGQALGIEVAGIHFPERVSAGGTNLIINGAGVRRATIFRVKVYAAALYVRERTTSTADVLRTDRPKYFVAVMKRDVSRDDSAPAFREGVERSAGNDVAAIRSEIVAFERWIPSMREGQQLTVSFTPDSGVVVRSTAKQDAFHGSIRFGTALFGMWIGPRATDADLRSALLSAGANTGT